MAVSAKRIFWLVVIDLLITVVVVIGIGQMGWLAGKAPTNLGVSDGRLQPPSNKPNSVSSQAALWPQHASAQIAPLAGGAAGFARLRGLLATWPGATVVTARDDYLYVQFTTRVMKFTDDAEFWLDPATGVVQVRSASRLGYSDMGTNRRRIEALRTALGAPV